MKIKENEILNKNNFYKIKIENLYKLTFIKDNTIDLFFIINCHEKKYLLFISTKLNYTTFESLLFFKQEEFKKEFLDGNGITFNDILFHYEDGFIIESSKNDNLIILENNKNTLNTSHFLLKLKEKPKLKLQEDNFEKETFSNMLNTIREKIYEDKI